MYNKKILVVVPTDRLGGAEINLKRIALDLKERGAELTIIFLSRGNNGHWSELKSSNCFYMKSNRESLGFIKALNLFWGWRSKNYRFDFSFTSHSHTNAYIGLLDKISLLKCNNIVYRESTNQFSALKGPKLKFFKMMYKLYSHSAFIICQTSRMRNEMLAAIPTIKSESVKVIGNPVDYLGVQKRSDEKMLTNAPVRIKEMVSVGRLVPEKDYPILIEALSLVDDKEIVLRILGSGPELDELQLLVRKLELKNRVIFMGRVDNPAPFMKNATLCIISSKLEGFPNVLLEMMCVGSRVVSTECTDDIKGLPGIHTCQPRDSQLLARIINLALSEDNDSVNRNVKAMRIHVKKRLVKTFVDEIIKNACEQTELYS